MGIWHMAGIRVDWEKAWTRLKQIEDMTEDKFAVDCELQWEEDSDEDAEGEGEDSEEEESDDEDHGGEDEGDEKDS